MKNDMDFLLSENHIYVPNVKSLFILLLLEEALANIKGYSYTEVSLSCFGVKYDFFVQKMNVSVQLRSRRWYIKSSE